MNLFVTIHADGFHGVSQSAYDVICALNSSGEDLAVFSNDQCKLSDSSFQSQAKVTWFKKLPEYPSLHIGNKIAFSIWMWLKNIRMVHSKRKETEHKIKDLHPKRIFVNSLGSHDLWVSLRSLFNTQVTLIVRESPHHFYDNSSRLKWAQEALQLYDNYIFVSDNVRQEWEETGILDSKRHYYIPNCCREDLTEKIQLKRVDDVRDKLGLPGDGFIITCVASIQKRKGQDILLEAVKNILKNNPSTVLCLVGPVLSDLGGNLLLENIDNYSFRDQVMFVDGTNDALSYIYASDLVVLPSRAEAMPRVILEAMALKKAIIASDVDGIPELIQDRKEGLLFPREDKNRLAQCLQTLLDDDALRLEYGENAYRKYWSSFKREKQIERWKEVLDVV